MLQLKFKGPCKCFLKNEQATNPSSFPAVGKRWILHDDYDTKFSTLIAENPGLMQRVPQYRIAYYLNRTLETLSRV